jgi:hypothetical protein
MAENLKSNPITNFDALPGYAPTTGEGGAGFMKGISDWLATTTSMAIWSTYRMNRFPTNAKVKHVWGYLTGIESAATTGAGIFDFNVAFSDDPGFDGTQSAMLAAIPSNKFDGSAYTMLATGYSTAYSSSGTGNKLFGASIAQVNSTATNTELTFKNGFTLAFRDDDMWDNLGFVNAQGTASDPGGFFDIFVVVAAAPTTAAIGKIGVEVDYMV